MTSSYVVTGGGRGVGRAIVERLLGESGKGGENGEGGGGGEGREGAAGDTRAADGAGNTVVVIEFSAETLAWVADHPAADRIVPVIGDAADEAVADRAAGLAERAAPLAGWVNNAAVFRDAWLHETSAAGIAELIAVNLRPAVTGCAAAVRRFLAAGRPGAIVNVSSHQAQRPVRGALTYATAKAAVEGLTRAMAVDYGPRGIRTNAVALGSIATERSDEHVAGLGAGGAERFRREIALLQPLGRMGRGDEVADVVAFLLSAGFVNGTIVPVDGGRSAVGRDPEEVPAADA